jgi:hypothetical protein
MHPFNNSLTPYIIPNTAYCPSSGSHRIVCTIVLAHTPAFPLFSLLPLSFPFCSFYSHFPPRDFHQFPVPSVFPSFFFFTSILVTTPFDSLICPQCAAHTIVSPPPSPLSYLCRRCVVVLAVPPRGFPPCQVPRRKSALTPESINGFHSQLDAGCEQLRQSQQPLSESWKTNSPIKRQLQSRRPPTVR